MNLYEKISNDIKYSMKVQDKETLSTLRLLKSAIDLYRINNKVDDITDEIVIEIVSKQVKTLKESIAEFKKANRAETVNKLSQELTLLSEFLPQQLNEEDINNIINEVFKKINPQGKKDLGLIMKELTPLVKGKVDMKIVSELVRNKLN